MKIDKKQFALAFWVIFTIVFMGIIFGPSEIFFGNYKELGFIYQEFGWKFCAAGVIIAVIISGIVSCMPEKLYKGVLALVTAVITAGYIQTMFLNRGLDQLGVTAEGYNPEKVEAIKNAGIWFLIIVIMMVIAYCGRCNYKKIFGIISGYLLLIQMVGFATLFINADEEAFAYPKAEIGLDMSEQLTVSNKENILVLCLDTVPNEWLEEAVRVYPGMLDALKDFTYYNNADCCYWGTFPSVIHVLTGNEFKTGVSMSDYISESWNNDKTNSYYELLEANDYKVNVYVALEEDIIGENTVEILKGKVSNILETENVERFIDYGLLYRTMITMSCYRYAPNVLKPLFNVTNMQYASIVTCPENDMAYANCDYYHKLLTDGITVTDECNYFSFSMLNGAHEFINDENCNRVTDGQVGRNETIKGIGVLLSEYIAQLQEKGVYDNSTIIIMSDHGTGENAQPIFLLSSRMKDMIKCRKPVHRLHIMNLYRQLYSYLARILQNTEKVFLIMRMGNGVSVYI